MPYNPGITDISGQLLGRGMESAAQARAQGIGAISNAAGGVMDFFAKRQEENKDLQAKNKAIENILSTHPEIFAPVGADKKPDEERLKMFLQTDPSENLKQKYARLSSFMEGTITSKKMEQMQQENVARNAQAALATAQANRAKYDLEQQKNEDSDYQDYLATRGKVPPSKETNGSTPNVSDSSNFQELISNVAGPEAAQAATQNTPAGVSQFMGAPVGSRVMPSGVANFMPPATQAQAGGDWLSAPTPPTMDDAATDLRKRPTGKNLQPVQTRQREMAKEWESAQKKTRGYDTPEGASQGALDAIAKGIVPPGTVPTIKQDANGRFHWETQAGTNPDTEAVQRGRIKQSELLNEAAVKENEADISAGRDAQKEKADSAAFRKALSDPNLYAGTGAETVNAFKKAGKALGMDVKGIDSYDTLNNLAGDQIINRVKELRPASDQDIRLLQDYGKSTTKTKEGNIAISNLVDRAADYKEKRADFINSLREAGIDENKIRIAKYNWNRTHPLTLTEGEQNDLTSAINGTPSNSPIRQIAKSKRLSAMASEVVNDPNTGNTESNNPIADMFKLLVPKGTINPK